VGLKCNEADLAAGLKEVEGLLSWAVRIELRYFLW
jgi:hypothetical protein